MATCMCIQHGLVLLVLDEDSQAGSVLMMDVLVL